MSNRLAVPQGDVQVMCRCREQADNEGVPPPGVGLRGLAPAPPLTEASAWKPNFENPPKRPVPRPCVTYERRRNQRRADASIGFDFSGSASMALNCGLSRHVA